MVDIKTASSDVHDWEIDYIDVLGKVGTMSVFAKAKIEDAIAEANNSLSLNFFHAPASVKPIIIGARIADGYVGGVCGEPA